MKNWTKPAITILALAAMSHVTGAQSGDDKMAKPMGKAKTYTGCIEAGASAGTFTLTHAMADMGMGKDAMKKDTMAKEGMSKDAMAPMSMAISSKTIDLSKHVGHKVTVTGGDAAMGMAPDAMAKPDTMAKPGEMGKNMPAMSITAIKMVASTCTM